MNFAETILSAPIGETHLFSVGQAGFLVKNSHGKLLGIDLYLSDYSEKDEGHVGFKRLLPKILDAKDIVFDYLIATHPHSDHYDYDSMKTLMDNGHTKLYASIDCKPLSKSLGINANVVYVKPGDYYGNDDFFLTFVNCDHGTGAPDAVGVIVETDGKKILEVGDTCLRLDRVPEYTNQGQLDVLIAPINGAYGNLNEHECAWLSASIKPNLTIPCHYGMFASHFGSPGKFMQEMAVLCPNNKYIIMTLGEGITI